MIDMTGHEYGWWALLRTAITHTLLLGRLFPPSKEDKPNGVLPFCSQAVSRATRAAGAGCDPCRGKADRFTEPVDLLIGSSYLKYIAQETGTPLVRVGFPIFDRHHLHRFPVVGYGGGIHLLTQLVNTVLDELDRTAPAHSFDAVR